jgi:hypothetical protein
MFFDNLYLEKKSRPGAQVSYPVSFPKLITLRAGRCGYSTHTMVWPGAGLQRPSDGPIGSITGGPLQLLLQVRMHFSSRNRGGSGSFADTDLHDPLYFGKPHPDLHESVSDPQHWLLSGTWYQRGEAWLK